MTVLRRLIWKARFSASMVLSGSERSLVTAWLWAAVALARYGLDKHPADAVDDEMGRW